MAKIEAKVPGAKVARTKAPKPEAPKTSAAKAKTPEPEAPDTTEAWRGFKSGLWQRDINVRWFLQQNYTPYEGDGKFLTPATKRTTNIWKKLEAMFVEERKKGVLDVS